MSATRTSRRDDALRWSRLAGLSVHRNETPVSARIARLTTFGDMVKLHIEDMTAVEKTQRRSKAATLAMLQRELGAIKIIVLDRERFNSVRTDTTRRCTSDENEIATDGFAQILVEVREERSGHRALDPAPIDGEDATYLPGVPAAAHPDVHPALPFSLSADTDPCHRCGACGCSRSRHGSAFHCLAGWRFHVPHGSLPFACRERKKRARCLHP